ncbi:hypothetical protein HMPREF0198_1595 [Cardiobacterium hominis ATCC 15826]|uniref:Uncharacterized protein n=1 Tax=Cardiobacterium hominis (strain ATCC 15826 / DSM 8339 / NCTC 10426 / 6573) TaxID=638300 RepID=C8NAR7_CARH6|nr:hypothetical protein HMPREF0198_1595 [Cardiobacterium hominis ATCC 15826]
MCTVFMRRVVGYFRNIVIRDDTNFLITTDAKNRAEARFF